jgi:hypothetical protein
MTPMRAITASRFIVFVTRRAGSVDFVAARSNGASFQAVAKKTLAGKEAATFFASLVAAGVEIVEVAAPARPVAALPSPTPSAVVPTAPTKLPKPVESEWLSFSEIVLETQKIRGPNA